MGVLFGERAGQQFNITSAGKRCIWFSCSQSTINAPQHYSLDFTFPFVLGWIGVKRITYTLFTILWYIFNYQLLIKLPIIFLINRVANEKMSLRPSGGVFTSLVRPDQQRYSIYNEIKERKAGNRHIWEAGTSCFSLYYKHAISGTVLFSGTSAFCHFSAVFTF